MRKIFHLCAKLFVDDSGIDKAFRTIHQNAMAKIKNYVSEDWIVEHSIKIFLCMYRGKHSIEKWT